MKISFAHRVAVGAVSLLLVAGCSSGGAADTSSAVAPGGAPPAKDSAQRNSAPGAKTAAGTTTTYSEGDSLKPGVVNAVTVGPKLTKSASLDVRVENIGAAAARVRTIALGLDALILNEQIGKGGPGQPIPLEDGKPTSDFGGFGTLSLSVPSDKLDVAMDQLAKVGTVLQRNTSSQDVTAQYVDTQSRLKTMNASVARVRALMAQAKDLGQVVALEGEVSRREAELESLQSQMDALKTSVQRSTLTMSLSTPGHEPATDNGFVAGLRSGWDAFTSSASGLLTGVGAVLPFAVFLALLGGPLWGWWRRNRANRPSATTPTAPTPTTSQAAAGPTA